MKHYSLLDIYNSSWLDEQDDLNEPELKPRPQEVKLEPPIETLPSAAKDLEEVMSCNSPESNTVITGREIKKSHYTKDRA